MVRSDVAHDVAIPVPEGLGGDAATLAFRVEGLSDAPCSSPETVLACHLIPAMRRGLALELPGEAQCDAASIMERLAAWVPSLSPVRLETGGDGARPPAGKGRTAAFFTGGVDSFYLLDRGADEIDALVYVLGFDVRSEQARLWESTRRMLEAVAVAYGKDLVVVETNLRAYLDRHASWEVSHGAALAAVAHLLAREFGRVLIASSFSDEQPILWGSHPELDPLWSTPTLDLEHVGGEATRLEKLRALASKDVALRWLRVCWKNPGEAYNCGSCSKCLRTRLALDALGLLDRCPSLSKAPRAREIRRLAAASRAEAYFITEVADEYDRQGVDSSVSRALRRWLRDHWGRSVKPVVPAAGEPQRRGDRLVVEEPRVQVDDEETHLAVRVRRGRTDATFEMRVPLGGREPARVGDALLLWFTLPAMGTATALEIQTPVSPELLERMERAQRVWASLRAYGGYVPVPVTAPVRDAGPVIELDDPSRPWASAFSGGIDSFHTALRQREQIAFLVGPHGVSRQAAEAVGLPLVEVRTNYREVVARDLGCRPEDATVLERYGLAHFLFPHVGGLWIGGRITYRQIQNLQHTTAVNPLFDPLVSSNDVRIRVDGMTHDRLQKLRDLGAYRDLASSLERSVARAPCDDPEAAEAAIALVSRFPLLSASTAFFRRTTGRLRRRR